MTVLKDKAFQDAYEAQQKATAQCSNYFYQTPGSPVQGFDSAHAAPEVLPDALKAIFDSIGKDKASNIDRAVHYGIAQYKSRHGGDLPHPSVIAAALDAGALVAKHQKSWAADVIKAYDSINNPKVENGFDDINNLHSEAVSIVPAMTVTTIANVIAYAMPIVAMIPNSNGSNEVPIVSARFITDCAFGAMAQGDYLDGVNSAKPYTEGRFRFALSNGGAGTTYTVVAHTQYDDFALKTPNTAAPLLPFIAGNISFRINGKEVANTRNRSKSKVTGTIAADIDADGIDILGTNYVVSASTINIDTSAISVTLNSALPAGAKLEAVLVADFQARDSQKNFKITPVGVDILPEYTTLIAAAFNCQVTAGQDLQIQLSNELNIGFIGSALAILQSKIYLEQTVRLLQEGKERAVLNGRDVYKFDMSRSVTGNLAAIGNTTGDLFAEVTKHIDIAKLDITKLAGGATVAWDLYVGDQGLIFFNQLNSDRMPTKTGMKASYGQIVRIGTLADGTNVYHTPTEQGVVSEAPLTFEMLLVGRGNEPVRCPFVGFIQTPMTLTEAKPDPRETVMGVHGQQAAEMNPLGRYADQIALITVNNAPKLKDAA